MALETMAALGASVLLLSAAVARGLCLFTRHDRWNLLAIGARVAAAVAVMVTLVMVAAAHGEWSPLELRQVTLGLAFAVPASHLILTWYSGVDGASPVVDLVALVLVAWGMGGIWPGGPVLPWTLRAVAYYVEWVLFLLGGGGVIVAGSTSLMLALPVPDRTASQAVLRRTGRALRSTASLCLRTGQAEAVWRGASRDLQYPALADLHAFLRNATALVLVALGSGLTVNLWWSWRTLGSLNSDDPRIVWMAGTWLVAGTSLLAWQVERRTGRWAAGLAMLAAALAVFGLLAVADLSRMLGI